MSIESTLEILAARRASAILRTSHADAVLPAMKAAIEGGFRIVEITLTTPGAFAAIQELARDGELLVGAGTVLTTEDAGRAVAAGARFLVSPVFDPEIVGWCNDHDVVAIPGTSTPTEMLGAHRAGAPIVKLFPGPAGGPDYVRTVLGPLPFLRIFPTSGVTEENAAAYLEAGSFGVGFVNCLFQPADLGAGRFEAIRERAERMIASTG